MERLMAVMPKKKLKKHLVKWINQGLTTEQKLFEVRLLLVAWDN
jgi:hypothetical protein